MNLKTGPDDSGRRLDRILRKALPDHPLSFIHRLLRQGLVLVDGKPAKPQYHVPQGVQITIPGDPPRPPAKQISTQPSNKRSPLPPPALDILWQGSGLLVINKPAGIAVHGPNSLDTQVQRYHAAQVSPHEEASLSFRPGPLHRLDKPTSGAIVFSTNLAGAQRFSVLLREGKINKFYLAIVEGRLEKAEIWKDQLTRKTQGAVNVNMSSKYLEMKNGIKPMSQGSGLAITSVSPLAVSAGKDKYSLILAQIHTGKTHQIRAQAAAHDHPLAGDIKYSGHISSGNLSGKDRFRETFFLHAWKIEIDETITAPPPESFLRQVKSIFGKELDALVNILFHSPCAGIL
jgi:23S rRNA pseudouridine955/2504/2580 synthase